MDLANLCSRIELPPEMAEKVLAFGQEFDFCQVASLIRGFDRRETMDESLKKLQAYLGEDTDHSKILACELMECVWSFDTYKKRNISEEIYIATMKGFSRMLRETYDATGKWCFDRQWWTIRQAGCHLFRVGELEYETIPSNGGWIVSIHIPSDARFSPEDVDRSLSAAEGFFAAHFPEMEILEYRCSSWLLDPQLRTMLRAGSHILSFQDRFTIQNVGTPGDDFLLWVYRTFSPDIQALPENTSLQRNLKRHLLSGGKVYSVTGILNRKQ